ARRQPAGMGSQHRRADAAPLAGYGALLPNRASSHQLAAETSAAPGIVRTHAHTTRPATPQRTALQRLSEPTPMMAPVIVCVVLTGPPPKMVSTSVAAAPDSAQKPSTGRRRIIF